MRKEFYEVTDNKETLSKFGLDKNKKTLLITGGSGGARFLNNAVLSLYAYAQEKDFQIIHVTGTELF